MFGAAECHNTHHVDASSAAAAAAVAAVSNDGMEVETVEINANYDASDEH